MVRVKYDGELAEEVMYKLGIRFKKGVEVQVSKDVANKLLEFPDFVLLEEGQLEIKAFEENKKNSLKEE